MFSSKCKVEAEAGGNVISFNYVFGYEKQRTNENFDLMLALNEKLRDYQMFYNTS